MIALELAGAERWAAVALDNVSRPFPYRLDQLLSAPEDVQDPRAIHPAFWGSYDWHSCVHMHWVLVRALRRFPGHRLAAASHAHLAARLTEPAIAGEVRAMMRPGHASFERPYGWGWLLKLAAELGRLAAEQPAAAGAARALEPLAGCVVDRYLDYLPRVDYPTRAGTHGNTAFALVLALDYARASGEVGLADLIAASARRWFAADRRYPAAYEPGGEDFLSPGLVEALLVQRTTTAAAFAAWWSQYEPESAALERWLVPVRISDAADPKIVHLHGLNLSRAWCWRSLAPHLPARLADAAERAAAAHVRASLPAATEGHYVGTHWLASFALLATDGD